MAKDGSFLEKEAEHGIGRGGANTPPKLRVRREARGLVAGAAERRRVEAEETGGESDRLSGRGTGGARTPQKYEVKHAK